MATSQDSNVKALVSVCDMENLPVVNNGEGEIMVIGDQEVPLVTSMMEVMIVQPGHVRKDKKYRDHIGKFYFKDFGDDEDAFMPTMKLLPIAVLGRGRRLFSKYEEGPNASNELLCYSNDGLTPADRVEVPFSPECGHMVRTQRGMMFEATCPKAMWIDGAKAECGQVVTVAFLDLTTFAPVRIQFKGVGISAFNKMMKDMERQRNVARLKRTKLSDYYLELTAKNEGTYVSPEFTYKSDTELNPGAFLPVVQWYYNTLVASGGISEDQNVAGASTASSVADADTVDTTSSDGGDQFVDGGSEESFTI